MKLLNACVSTMEAFSFNESTLKRGAEVHEDEGQISHGKKVGIDNKFRKFNGRYIVFDI